MFLINPVVLNFVAAPETPRRGELPVLIVDKSGRLSESWNVWGKRGQTFAQLTDKSVVEVVGWTSIQKRVNYGTSENSDTAEETKDYVTWDQIDKNKKRKARRKPRMGGNRSSSEVRSVSSGTEKAKS